MVGAYAGTIRDQKRSIFHPDPTGTLHTRLTQFIVVRGAGCVLRVTSYAVWGARCALIVVSDTHIKVEVGKFK